MNHEAYDERELAPALGLVLDEDRGALPYALVHGEALVACAAWALGGAGVTPIDVGVPWSSVQTAGEAVVLHDALCPMTPAGFIADCVEQALEHDAVVVAVRPVTDTVKHVDDGLVGATVDREGLLAPSSPVVLPPSVVAALDDYPGQDLTAIVARLRGRHAIETVEAPPEARRVAGAADIALLEALTGEAPTPF
ncbi:2-C-methyl-D-erythritol 4-phosphate cytidylyltransferase [Nocardioides sp. P5_C9_2]